MTGTSADSSPGFARRYLRLAVDAGWRVALHVMPYALAAGVITEGLLRLRIGFGWKLPLALAVLACLHLAVLLGAHIAMLRAADAAGEMPPVRHHVGVAGRVTAESALVLLIVLIASLAMVGALDLTVAATDPVPGASWPQFVLRAIAILTVLAVMSVLLAAAVALAASFDGRPAGLAGAARRLLVRSDRATGVLCVVIAAGTLAVVLAGLTVRAAGLGPPIIEAALAKAAGYLAAIVMLSVGAAAVAADD